MECRGILVAALAALAPGFGLVGARAATVAYDLTIAREAVRVGGKTARGMTINNRVPGPTLRFTEGDIARIRVHNHMREATSIHRRGLLVPPGMDGVPYVSFPPIPPGETAAPRGADGGKGKTAAATHGRAAPPSGKRFGTRFGLLASDVAASGALAVDGMDPRRPRAPYTSLRAVEPTAFPKDRPVRVVRLTLDGDMERYVWSLNNKPLPADDSIRIKRGEVVRFVMINRTMMHHPMHLHGHFFRVLNGRGAYSPLKHTVDVAPMSTTVIEFAADEVGDWFFHCHLLYHMKAGMARVVHYEDYTPDAALAAVRLRLYKSSWYWWGRADALSNMTEGCLTLNDTRNIFAADWEAGWGKVDDLEWEGLFTYDRYVNRFFSLFVGLDPSGAGGTTESTRGICGIRCLLPLNVESRSWLDTAGGARIALAKTVELTPRRTLDGSLQYDTHDMWEKALGLS